MHISSPDRKGRGAQHNPHNAFQALQYDVDDTYREYCALEEEDAEPNRTRYLEVFPKDILSRNNSPDVPFEYSINPYQGCEHGCTYCYARNTHTYWGYSAGVDFERVIMVKKDAAQLLDKRLSSRGWEPKLIALSGNTDCYQPADRRFGITRQLLEVFIKHKHPVGIITKNSLILRDLDLLKALHRQHLLRVTLSITTLNEDVRRVMEPRTASVYQRLKTLEVLTRAGIPVSVNMAPIIPGINSHEIPSLVKEVARRGANKVNYIMVRLNGQIGEVFANWVYQTFPERADKILHLIEQTHGGQLNDSHFGDRMRGEGAFAEQVKQLFGAAVRKHVVPVDVAPLDFDAFEQQRQPQLSLF